MNTRTKRMPVVLLSLAAGLLAVSCLGTVGDARPAKSVLPSNLFDNGSFEEGAAPWFYLEGNKNWAGFSISAERAWHGEHSARLSKKLLRWTTRWVDSQQKRPSRRLAIQGSFALFSLNVGVSPAQHGTSFCTRSSPPVRSMRNSAVDPMLWSVRNSGA